MRTWIVTATIRLELDDPPEEDENSLWAGREKVRYVRPMNWLRNKIWALQRHPNVSIVRVDWNPSPGKEVEEWITR